MSIPCISLLKEDSEFMTVRVPRSSFMEIYEAILKREAKKAAKRKAKKAKGIIKENRK